MWLICPGYCGHDAILLVQCFEMGIKDDVSDGVLDKKGFSKIAR